MTSPIMPDGGNSPDPIPPISPIPSLGGGGVPEKTQIVHFLGGTVLSMHELVNFKMSNIKPMHKHQHDVAKDLINKFKPVLTELAVLALRSQQSQPRIEKPPASTPSESGTRRDEATAKGSTTLGKDLVNIEVHGGEEGRNDPQQQSQSQSEGKPVQLSTPGMQEGKTPVEGQKGENVQGKKGETSADSNAKANVDSNAKAGFNAKADSNAGTDANTTLSTSSPHSTTSKSESTAEPESISTSESKSESTSEPKTESTSESKTESTSEPRTETKDTNVADADLPTTSSEKPQKDETQNLASEKIVVSPNEKSPAEKSFSEGIKDPSLENAAQEEASKEILNQNTGKEPSSASQIVASKAAQETQTKPVETQPKDPNSNVASHKTSPTEENAPDKAIGLKEVPKSEESHVQKEKEIPKDVAGQLIDKENVYVHKKHEDAAVFAFLATRTQSEEPTPTAQHKMFQNIGNDPKGFVPPWLGLLLPDLIKAKTARDTKGGGQKGQKLQKPHKLTDILFMLLSAHIAGARSLSEIFSFIQSREKWFSVILGLSNGMPPRQLIFWFLTSLDPRKFDLIMRRWLEEVLGRNQGRSRLLDVKLWETPLGFIIGQTRRPEGNFSTDELTSFSDGFAWRNSVLLINSDKSYGSLFAKIQQQGGHYLAEVGEELIPAEEHEAFESYLEGQERIVVQEWHSEEQSETQIKVSCEIIESDGAISRFERFLISDLESPAGYYFDLFRLQRSEESKCSWLLNTALSFPSMDEALESCAATLSNFHDYAKEIISINGDGSSLGIKEEMEKAAISNDYLLGLLRKR